MYIHDTDRVQQVGGEAYVDMMYMGAMSSNDESAPVAGPPRLG